MVGKARLNGILTVTETPFDGKGRIDFEAYGRHRSQIIAQLLSERVWDKHQGSLFIAKDVRQGPAHRIRALL